MSQWISEGSRAAHESTKLTSDEKLVSNAASGDRSAFDELCLRHAKKIKLRIYRITKNWEDAEDALQESYLKAFIHLNTFEGRASFSSWLTSIAINTALMHLRKRRPWEVPLDQMPNMSHLLTWKPWGYAETPEKQYLRRETESSVRRAILNLPSSSRKIIELRGIHEHSAKEIAIALGISLGAARARLSRARTILRASLRQKLEHGPQNQTQLSLPIILTLG